MVPGRRGLWLVLAVTISLFLVYSAVGERGLIRLKQMVSKRDELKYRVRSLEDQNARLARQIGLLRDDPGTIENLARTELGMVREGETVYILPDQPGGEPR